MNRLRLAASIVYRDLAIDAVDPVVIVWLRGVLFTLACIAARLALVPIPVDPLDLAVLGMLLPAALLVQWRALRPHILHHPAIQHWAERDPGAYRALRWAVTILIYSGLLPLALLLGLLFLLTHAALTTGLSPTPVAVVVAPPAAAEVRPAPDAVIAARGAPPGLPGPVRAPPAFAIADEAVVVAAPAATALALWNPSALSCSLALLLVAIGRVLPRRSPFACGVLLCTAAPRAPPLAA